MVGPLMINLCGLIIAAQLPLPEGLIPVNLCRTQHQVSSDRRIVAMTKPTAQTGLTCCAAKTAHRLEFTRVEVEEILRLPRARQPRRAPRRACARRLSRPDGLARGRAGQTDRQASWPRGTPCAAATLFISPPCFRRAGLRTGPLSAGRAISVPRPQARYKLVPL
jgi:hypothetical protein